MLAFFQRFSNFQRALKAKPTIRHVALEDTLIRLANRRCERFSGQEVGLSIAPPISKEDAVQNSV